MNNKHRQSKPSCSGYSQRILGWIKFEGAYSGEFHVLQKPGVVWLDREPSRFHKGIPLLTVVFRLLLGSC